MADTTDASWDAAKNDIVTAANAAGVDVGIMAKIAGFESQYDPHARPVSRDPDRNKVTQFDGVKALSSGYGYGQFIDRTWADMVRQYGEKYGLDGAGNLTNAQANMTEVRNNTLLQAGVLAEYTRENVAKGVELGGLNPDANVYALHNLGSLDGPRFLNALKDNPSQRVDAVLSAGVIRGNNSLYGDGSGTVADAYKKMGQQLDRYEKYATDAKQAISEQSYGAQQSSPLGHTSPLALKQGAHGSVVSTLQADLAALGYTDNRGKPLQPDGHYGRNTEAAVMAFQSDHGLHSDGVAGKNTFDAIQSQRQLLNGIPALAPEMQGNPHPYIDSIDPANRAPAQRDLRAPALPDTTGPAVNPFADPKHPNHGLYAELRERIPNASENRIVQCTAACHMSGIRSGELGHIHLRGEEALVFAPNGVAGSRAEVALTSPAPSIQQTMLQVQSFEQNMQMQIAQMNAQQQQTGPVLGGPRMG